MYSADLPKLERPSPWSCFCFDKGMRQRHAAIILNKSCLTWFVNRSDVSNLANYDDLGYGFSN